MLRLILWVLLSAAVALLGSSSPMRDDPDFAERPITLVVKPVATTGLSVGNDVVIVGAWEVTSSDGGFGGVSAMAVEQRRMTLVTDTGSLIDVRPRFAKRRANGRIQGIASECGYDGQKTSRDSESLAVDPASGVRWIGFEWRNVICRIDPRRAEANRFFAPAAMREWPSVGGAEAMTRLRDGRFIAIAERPRDKGANSPIVIFYGDPVDPATVADTRIFVPPSGFRPTDMVELPDGSLLILTRSFRPPFGFDGRLVAVSREAIGTPRIKGKTIARFNAPLNENFEAIAVTHGDGHTHIWLMTDDNFMPFQRSILVLLEYRS